MKTGIELIAEERTRQIEKEGYDAKHDDRHVHGEIGRAGRCYHYFSHHGTDNPPSLWPWGLEWWKPSEDAVRNLVKAGALYQAEIDRLNRRIAVCATAIDHLQSPQKR